MRLIVNDRAYDLGKATSIHVDCTLDGDTDSTHITIFYDSRHSELIYLSSWPEPKYSKAIKHRLLARLATHMNDDVVCELRNDLTIIELEAE